jgi:hypothetical protein
MADISFVGNVIRLSICVRIPFINSCMAEFATQLMLNFS